MLEVKEKVKLNVSLFDTNVKEYINSELRNTMGDDEYKYNLTIYFHSSFLSDKTINAFLTSIKRNSHDATFREKTLLVLRMLISNIIEYLEDHYFSIYQVYVYGNKELENEVVLEKSNVEWKANEKEKTKKIHLDILQENDENIHAIVDSILFKEETFFIDERNNDRKLFNSLLLKKEESQSLDYMDLTSDDWKQLILKEKVTTKDLAILYDVKESEIMKQRKQFIKNQKEYYDEYIFYEVMVYRMNVFDYFSNFSIPMLEQMKAMNIQVIYSYENSNYHELFVVSEELERQKEIEKNNLSGKPYIVPLSGILLKKLYAAAKNNLLDRKILKNNYFATYYSADIFPNLIRHIEESHVLELYETGDIYKSPYFKTYQETYKVNEEEKKNELKLVPTEESKEHIMKKRKRIVVPKDYVKLTEIKNSVGSIGQDLVFIMSGSS